MGKQLVVVHQKAPQQETVQAQNSGDDESRFMEPVAYFGTPTKRAPSSGVQNAKKDFEGGAAYALPQHYAAANEMLDPEELRQQVLRAMAKVDRAPVGSAERLAAERELISVRSNARTSCRARASELEAQLAALKRPGADDAERNRLKTELDSVTSLLRALDDTEDTAPSKATNASGDSWTNSFGETVRMVNGVPRVVK